MKTKNIIIESPSVTDNNNVIWPIVIDGNREEIQTKVSDNVVPYLTLDRIDSIVTGLLIYAIRNGYDFKSDLPISDELMYGLTYHLIPAISTKAHKPTITAPIISTFNLAGNIVATGISCGVDSLYTIATHTQLPNLKDNITHLAFFDAGSHHSDKGPSITKDGRRKLAKKFASDNNFEFIEVSSTLPDFIDRHTNGGYSHLEHHTFMMLHCVLSIAKGMRRYYYSAGLTYGDFNCSYEPTGNFDAASYDLLTLMAASYGSIRFYSSGGEVSRLEKLRLLANYPPAHKSLNVCVTTVKNDNICFKCARTLLELDALDRLDDFNEVFDIEYYRQHRINYLEDAYIGALKGDPYLLELLPEFKQQMNIGFKIKAILKKAISVIKNRI